MSKLNLLLVGCGKMGHALLQGWKKNNIIANCHVIDPALENLETISAEIFYHASLDMIEAHFIPDVVVFAVKPQIMDTVVPAYRKFSAMEAVFLSIAAGKNTTFFESHLGHNAKVIRAMPNTPAAIGQGMTVAYPNSNVELSDKERTLPLLTSVGLAEWIEDENLLDAVTAVSGSGPAYIFHLIEALTDAATNAGLPTDLAAVLARQTVIGSAALADDMSDISAAILRENVTSPGGTTATALDVLMRKDNGLKDLMSEAVDAAVKRSKELSK